jgi:hypothetical protein
MPALALCLCSLPAVAGPVLFSDLGPPGNLDDCCTGWTVSGWGAFGTSYTSANLFTVAGSGSFSVTEIDLGVSNMGGNPDTFYAGIWTDNYDSPWSPVAGAYWNPLYATTILGNCCALVSITGITGVTLTGGQQYFMLAGPLDTSDDSWNAWTWNTQGVTGDVQYSTDSGDTWNDLGSSTLGAFESSVARPFRSPALCSCSEPD